MSNKTSVAALELLLPKDATKDAKKKDFVQMSLDVLVQDLVNRIREDFGLEYIKLIFRGKILSPDKRLDEEGLKNHSKIMVTKVTDREIIRQIQQQEEEKRNKKEKKKNQKVSQERSVQRTQKGFQILSERDGSEHMFTPYLEIADQKGNSLEIPEKERKALILAMGLHEKGRSLMKRKEYDNAVCHLLKADEEFRKCDPGVLTAVDNYAVLQLDIVWCHRALEALSCLDDAKRRLQMAEICFLHCYGEDQERLRMIKGNAGREQVLFLRLYLLQSLLSHLEGNNSQAQDKLSKVESLYGQLCPDSEKMNQLLVLGFTEREARLALRACQGDLQEARIHITERRQELEELWKRDLQKKRSRMDNMRETGLPRRPAAASHLASGHMSTAFLGNQSITQRSTSAEDDELVNEALQDISRHEEDYLDLTLEEEKEFIKKMKTYLNLGSTNSV